MWIDHGTLFKPITKASFKAAQRNDRDTTVAEALRIALTEPRGRCISTWPEDVALAEADEELPDAPPGGRQDPFSARRARRDNTRDASPPPRAVPSPYRRERDAHGSGPRRCANSSSAIACPSPRRHGQGIIDEDHPLSLGCHRGACRQVQRRFIRDAPISSSARLRHDRSRIRSVDGRIPVLHMDIQPARRESSVNVVHEASAISCVGHRARGARACRERVAGSRRRGDARHFSKRCVPPRKISLRIRRSTPCAACCRAAACSLRRRRAHPPDREPMDAPRTAQRSHYDRLVIDGFGLPARSPRRWRGPSCPWSHRRRRLLQMTCGELAVADASGSRSVRRPRRPWLSPSR